MDKAEKLKIVERLVNENHLTFSEGLALMETEKEYIYTPQITYPYWPIVNPTYTTEPLPDSFGTPLPDDYYFKPGTCFDINSPFNKPMASTYTIN